MCTLETLVRADEYSSKTSGTGVGHTDFPYVKNYTKTTTLVGALSGAGAITPSRTSALNCDFGASIPYRKPSCTAGDRPIGAVNGSVHIADWILHSLIGQRADTSAALKTSALGR